MNRVTLIAESVPLTHPLFWPVDGVAADPVPGERLMLWRANKDEDPSALQYVRTSKVEAILYRRHEVFEGQLQEIVVFKTENTRYLMTIYNEVK